MQWKQRLKQVQPIKKVVYFLVGVFTYPGLALLNRIKITGTEHLRALPPQKVLFVSNHQTYFADVIAFLHIFSAVKWGKRNRLGLPYYLLNPFTKVNYVAAEVTMRGSWLSRLFLLAGGLTVKRTWNKESGEVRRGLDASDTRKIFAALEQQWVITFPQGTTTPYAPGRKGTALIIKQVKPLVVPVVIDGFWRAFHKKGLRLRQLGSKLTVRFKAPLNINYDQSTEAILAQLMDSIEQQKPPA